MKDFNLFSFGCDLMRLQSSPSQVELHEMEQDLAATPPFRLTVSEVDRMAGLDAENVTESRQHHNTRPQRHE